MASHRQRMELSEGPTKASSEGIGLSRLVEMCLKAACESRESVQSWRRQKRTLKRLPSHLAHPLFHRLLQAGLLNAPLLELFQDSVEEVRVCDEASVDAEWTSYFRGFHCLRVLELANCRSISNFAIAQLKGLESLEELNISCCPKISDEGLAHLASLTSLEKLGLSETKVTEKGLTSLSALKGLTSLDLGGLPVTDSIILSLLALSQLQNFDIWGSRVSDQGVLHLKGFPCLRHLNLAWTGVTRVPPLQSLKHLNMANCTILSIFEDWEGLHGPLEQLYLSGANILDSSEVLAGRWASNVLVIDLSSSDLKDFKVLGGMRKLEILDLSGTKVPELAMHTIAEIGYNLKQLDLSGCKVSSQGLGALAGHVPKLQQLVLSGTLVDDSVFVFLQLMPALKMIDLSYTNIKGFNTEVAGKASKLSSFAAIQYLHSMTTLNLCNTLISDKACLGLSYLLELTHLRLRSNLLSDSSLHFLSSLKKLISLSIEGAMLTDSGVLSFKPPPLLKELSLLDCWLLTQKGIRQFCEAHRGLMVRHALLSGGSGSLNGISVKDSKIKGTPNSQRIKSGKTKSPPRWNAEPMDHRKTTESSTVLADERIRYTKADLLGLRDSQHYSEQLSGVDLSKIPPGLFSVDKM